MMVTNPFIDRSYAFVVGHDWTIGSNKANQFFLGETLENYSYPNAYNPDGANFLTFGDGTQASLASSLYLNPNAQGRRVPLLEIGDNFTWTKGAHTLQMGGTFEDIRAKNTNVIDYNTIESSVRKTGRLLVVHESPLIGGHGAEVAAQVGERCFAALRGPIRRIGAPDIPLPQSAELERRHPREHQIKGRLERIGAARQFDFFVVKNLAHLRQHEVDG